MILANMSWLNFRCNYVIASLEGLPRWLSGKESACLCRCCRGYRFDPRARQISWRRKWHHSSILTMIIPWTEELGGPCSKGSQSVVPD